LEIEKSRPREVPKKEKRSVTDLADEIESLRSAERPSGPEAFRRTQEIIERYQKDYRNRSLRRKLGGGALALLGLGTIASSCPFYAFSLIGPHATIVGIGLLVVGGLLIFLQPKRRDVNHAIMIAMKHGNILTVPRLALEMDVSMEKAEKIISELVLKGLAEIDLDIKDPNDVLVYRIKPL
jgi:hypothetical protein